MRSIPGPTGGLNESEFAHWAPGAGAQTRLLTGFGFAEPVVAGIDGVDWVGAPNVLGDGLLVEPSAEHDATTTEATSAPTHWPTDCFIIETRAYASVLFGLPSIFVDSNGDRQRPDVMDAYLRRLQVEAEPPSVEALFRIHRAHVDRVPYETTWIHLGEEWTIDSDAAVERIARGGRGGYCFHLNGSLARLLSSLGYDVSLHIGGVHGPEPSEDDLTNHLVLLVSGLPRGDNPAGVWYVDAGLGDALYEPLPLNGGTYAQAPMAFRLSETPGGVGDWHFEHDPQGSFPGMNFRSAVATINDFEPRHRVLSTSPDSGFVKTVTAQRRQQDRVLALRALTYKSHGASGSDTTFVTDRRAWFDVLAGEFLLPLDGVDDGAKDRLWASAQASHDAWLATQ